MFKELRKKIKALKNLIIPEWIRDRPDRLNKFYDEFPLLLREKKYQEVIQKYNNLMFYDKYNPHIYFYYISADNQLKEKYSLINSLYHNQPKRTHFLNALLIFILLGGAVLYFYNSVHISIIRSDDDLENNKKKNKKKNFFGTSSFQSSLFKDNFEVEFVENVKDRLADVRGIDEVKEEIEQIIRMIKDPIKYISAGAKLHKGILLCGKPGTGKTLIARAIAGEARVKFISITGSHFDEMFVGVGAERIKKLFEEARNNSPCIIFIDEIDSLLSGSRRGFYEHSSSRATINQFLAELDGFEPLDNVIVIGATNHEKDLDSAAVRPGRFDKKIFIHPPDENGRTQVLDFYINKINLKKDQLIANKLSKMTPGFTGADLENVVNISVINAVNRDNDEVTLDDFGEARDRILMGISRKNYNVCDKKRFLTSLHEAGHTLICYKSEFCRKNLHKVTIIPRGPAEGITFTLADEESMDSKEEYLSQIDMAMGGHTAEELLYGEDNVTAGCSSDLNKATVIAKAMVEKLGMYGDQVGYIYVEDKKPYWEEDTKVSEKYKSQIDMTVKQILKESHDRVYKILEENANDLKNIAQKLFEYDTLEVEDIDDIIKQTFQEGKKDRKRERFDEKKI